MSTWDDKPNDYEHAVAWALEERGKVASFAAALKALAERTLEYVGPEGDPKLDADAEMRKLALEGLALLGIAVSKE